MLFDNGILGASVGRDVFSKSLEHFNSTKTGKRYKNITELYSGADVRFISHFWSLVNVKILYLSLYKILEAKVEIERIYL